MRIPRDRRQAGDTIVEVLICIGIVSVVLTGAFVVANRSSAAVQDSNEHSQAELKLQSQVELLRQYLTTTAVGPNATYCMSDGSTATTSPDDQYSDTDPCFEKVGGAEFHTYFSQQNDVYTFTVTWDSVSGGKAKESYVYRVYPG